MSNYLDLSDPDEGGGSPITVFWSDKQPDRIRVMIADPRITAADGTKPGMQIHFSSNLKSADYNPNNFNRFARLLAATGRPAPDEVEEHPRHLKHRDALIKATTTPSDPAEGITVPPAEEDIEVCTHCWCYVLNLAAHLSVAHPEL